ncbi:hypothetical protein [Georgenia muralis]|uniref:Uncharacterized protein n=1 Tax=Georgenia muralis TaxID=154117 RepID=A0A3N4ZZL0_9MICO|nr:hypothetical protein [Georgenia muralis]RPF26505.1 hypothetical protein EDD32_0949 [Georgenia muralis]
MTVAATLTVQARTEGFIARLRRALATPVLSVDGVETDLSWLGERRLVVAPGTHEVGVHYRNRRSTHGRATTSLTVAPGGEVALDAVLVDGTFRLAVRP